MFDPELAHIYVVHTYDDTGDQHSVPYGWTNGAGIGGQILLAAPDEWMQDSLGVRGRHIVQLSPDSPLLQRQRVVIVN